MCIQTHVVTHECCVGVHRYICILWLISDIQLSVECVFFFQAKDGIRDLVRSRGLGDVYKRQAGSIAPGGPAAQWLEEHDVAPADYNSFGSRRGNPVSYTHLMLPTIYSV